MRQLAVAATRGLIRAYQLAISPLLGPRCRFYPTCSSYALEAVDHHGVLRGLAMTAWRLARCHPWHPGGYDPCPPAGHRTDGLPSETTTPDARTDRSPVPVSDHAGQ